MVMARITDAKITDAIKLIEDARNDVCIDMCHGEVYTVLDKLDKALVLLGCKVRE